MKRWLLTVAACLILLVTTVSAAPNQAQEDPNPCNFSAALTKWLDLADASGTRQRNLKSDLRALNQTVVNDPSCVAPTTTTSTSTTTTTTTLPTTTTTAPTTTTTTAPTTTTTTTGVCTTHQGDLTVNTAGTVIDNLCMVDGTIVCNAANIAVRNSQSSIHSGWAIEARPGCTGLRVTNMRIDCHHVPGTNGFAQDNGFVGQNIELHNLDVAGCENGVFIDNGVKLFDSFIHDPLDDGLSGAHSDGVQLWAGASDVVVQGNTVDYRGNTTSAMISGGFEPDPNFGFTSDVLITGNLFGGGAATLYIPAKEDCCGEAATHIYDTVRVTNNRFMQDAHAFFYCDGDETRLGAWTGNVIDETNAPLVTCD